MASRRSHAPTHSRNANQLRVPRGHVSIRNPLQAPKERSCGISTHHHPLVPRSGTDYHPKHHTGCVSPPFGELYLGGGVARTHSCAASQLAVGFHDTGPAQRNPQLILNLLASVGARLPMTCCTRVRGYGETP